MRNETMPESPLLFELLRAFVRLCLLKTCNLWHLLLTIDRVVTSLVAVMVAIIKEKCSSASRARADFETFVAVNKWSD